MLFFIISGYVSSHIYNFCEQNIKLYYIDRFLRIYPAYLASCLIAVLIWKSADIHSYFLSREPSSLDLISNATAIPLNFYPWTGQDRITLIPQAWSLALELQFYVMLPLIFGLSKKALAGILMLSFTVWLLACFQFIDSDVWGYRMLPGTLWIFLAGLCVAKGFHKMALCVFIAVAIIFVLILFKIVKPVDFNLEQSLGFCIGLPALFLLKTGRSHHVDRFLGLLSYPLFLVHFSCIWICHAVGYDKGPMFIALTVGLSFCLSALVFICIERPLAPIRSRLRKKGTDARATMIDGFSPQQHVDVDVRVLNKIR